MGSNVGPNIAGEGRGCVWLMHNRMKGCTKVEVVHYFQTTHTKHSHTPNADHSLLLHNEACVRVALMACDTMDMVPSHMYRMGAAILLPETPPTDLQFTKLRSE